MPTKRTTKVKYYTLTDSGYIEIDATPQELETYLEESQEWRRIKHGHWTDDCRCSECGAEAITEWNETGGAWVMTPFCPFCGTDMEMEEQT